MEFKEAMGKFLSEEGEKYDSSEDTKKHITRVDELLTVFGEYLTERGELHDQSKLQEPEKDIFDKCTPALKQLTYGSDEYQEQLKSMKVALDHHYENNRHHPEHHKNGIRDMNLVDIVELFVDWRAATERHADGDIVKSINHNQERFGYSDDIKEILLNSVELFETKKETKND